MASQKRERIALARVGLVGQKCVPATRARISICGVRAPGSSAILFLFFLIVGSIAARTTIWIRHCAPPTPRARMHGPTAGRRCSHRRLHRGTCHGRGSTATRDACCGTALLPPASSRGGAGLLVSWCSGRRAGEGAWCSWFLGDWVSEATEMARARVEGRVLCYWRSDRQAEETVTSSLFLGAPMRRERKEERSSLWRLLRGALGTKRGEDPSQRWRGCAAAIGIRWCRWRRCRWRWGWRVGRRRRGGHSRRATLPHYHRLASEEEGRVLRQPHCWAPATMRLSPPHATPCSSSAARREVGWEMRGEKIEVLTCGARMGPTLTQPSSQIKPRSIPS